jgi:hypothetical protein
LKIHSYLSSKVMWLFLRSRSYSIHKFLLMIRISSSTIDCQLCAISWKRMRIDFLSTCSRRHTYESELMMMSWSIWSFDFWKIRSSRTLSRKKFLMIYIRYSMIRIVAQMLWRRIDVSNKSNRSKILISSELNFSDSSAIQNFIIKTLCSRISRIRCRTNCKKLSLSNHTKSSICMNSSKCADILIRRWETWTISQNVKNFSVMQHETKKSLSLLIRIRIIKSIKTLINRSHVHDLKSLNSNLNQILEQSLNHRRLKIKWISSIVTIVKNQDISLAIVVNQEEWIRITSYEKWTYMIKTIYLLKILRSNREKTNLCYNRSRDKWDENNEDRCLQLRRHSLRW